MTYEEMYDLLSDALCVDKDALDLAFAIGGCNEETAERMRKEMQLMESL